MEYALRLLSARDYPEKRLREKLRDRYDREEEEETIRRLKGYGYIDDNRFAKLFIASKLRAGYGTYYIRPALWERGIEIEDHFFDAVIAEYDIDIERIAYDVLEKYLRRKKNEEYWKKKRNAFAYMMRRGYNNETIERLMREYFEDESDFS